MHSYMFLFNVISSTTSDLFRGRLDVHSHCTEIFKVIDGMDSDVTL